MVGRRAELSSGKRMPTVTTSDGVEIFYKDWGSGQPVVFSHCWPLTADVWDSSANVVASHGFHAVAHDRRGGGRSSQPWDGNDLDHYADDVAAVIEAVDLHNIVLVGHSTGGGEVTRYVGRYGTSRVAKMVLLLSLIHISEPTRLLSISYAVFCLKKKTHNPFTNIARIF